LVDYEPVVGKSVIEELRLLAGKLSGKVIQNINSTFTGGGVAEILNRMVPMAQQLGVDVRWNIIKGNDEFFTVTKKISQCFARQVRNDNGQRVRRVHGDQPEKYRRDRIVWRYHLCA